MMNRNTGKIMSEEEHITQSVIDIITTPLGSRVGLRDYGSKLYSFIDQNPSKMDLYIAIYEALDKWEKRFILKKVNILDSKDFENGQLVIELLGEVAGNMLTIALRS